MILVRRALHYQKDTDRIHDALIGDEFSIKLGLISGDEKSLQGASDDMDEHIKIF